MQGARLFGTVGTEIREIAVLSVNCKIEDYGIARTYRCTGQSYRYPFPQMGTDGKTSLGTDAVPVEHRYRYRKRHCSASRTLVQVQTYRISTVPVEYRYR